ncbi:nucleotidyltransferase family protein [bacterium]|nr:nucleotidyltransferase family protein [bacterium]
MVSDSCAKKSIGALVLAAGKSERMGEFKPLMKLRGKTLIENTVDSVLDGGADSVTVVVGCRGDELIELLSRRWPSAVNFVRNPDFADTDMLRSIKLGCAGLPECEAFFLLPGDMPVVRRETFRLLCREADRCGGSPYIIFPALEGYRKHPPLIHSHFIREILQFEGGGGLREFWRTQSEYVKTVDVDDLGVWVDLDTRKDYFFCKAKYENEDR